MTLVSGMLVLVLGPGLEGPVLGPGLKDALQVLGPGPVALRAEPLVTSLTCLAKHVISISYCIELF